MSTLFSFVPNVKTGVKVTSSSGGLDVNQDIYTAATWIVPPEKSSNSFVSSPYPFDFHKAPELSEEAKSKLQKSKEDFSRAIAAKEDFEKSLLELSVPDTHTELAETSATSTDSSLIPKSYEEIFSISVKNRMKNKEKKRARDDETNGPDEGDMVAGTPGDTTPQDFSNLKGQEYFVNSAVPVETDVNSTLDFGAQIGWVKNAEHRNTLKESYLREASEQQSDANETGMNSTSSKFNSSSGGKPTNSSMERKTGGSTTKSFEYPKFNNATSIGAMPLKTESTGQGNSHNVKKAAGKNHQQQQPFRVKAESHANPYLSQLSQFEK